MMTKSGGEAIKSDPAGGETIKSDPAFEEYKYRYYKELTLGLVKIKFSEKVLKCPYCPESREYTCREELCRHASRIARESRSAGFKEKAKHMGLLEFLERAIKPSESNSKSRTNPHMGLKTRLEEMSKRSEEHQSHLSMSRISKADSDMTFINQQKEMMLENFKRDLIILQERARKEVKRTIIEHEKSKTKSDDRMLKLVDGQKREIEKLHHQIVELQNKLNVEAKKKIDLYTCLEVETEEVKNSEFLLGLKTILEVSKRREEIQNGISRTDSHMAPVMKQKEMLIEHFNSEHKMMQENANEKLRKITIEYEKSKLQLEERENELRDARKESEKMKLENEKNMKKADERMLKMANENKIEQEKLQNQIIKLQSKLDDKRLQSEINEMKKAMEVMKHMNDGADEARKKFESIEEDLKEKEEELERFKELYQALIAKERNDELQDARHEIISGLKEFSSSANAHIGVKRMSELNAKPFMVAAKRSCLSQEVSVKFVSLWEDRLRDPNWHPFIREGEGKEMLNEEDEKLASLKAERDEDLYNVVVTAE